ncbi:isochorismatase family protein [Paenibacillus physcomitrellae]|uniref:N-carbamoylsarcosine amidase n=1 Tax=Paenibacillus physcomitrellae TaxID=1619311 RepID=A0ABQ1G095_9BACL|nr:isochorismatase family protein [Paenibacillus physcomitrellae]GGA33884.1 N-carbamoylsarcosine amidase [Paenibacillus physcomitrellae]
MKVWDNFLTDRDKLVFGSAGYDVKGGFGKRPAVLVVDVNYAFCGHIKEPILDSVQTWRNSCGEDAWEAIPYIQKLLGAAREQRVPIFYSTGIDRRSDGFDAGGWRRKNSRSGEKKGIPGFGGNEIVREIAPQSSDIVIEKLKPSPFHGTPLLGFLTDLGIDTLLICGTTTSGCVRASVIDAFSYNFNVGIVEECTFDRGQASHAINLFDMNAKYADVIKTEEAVSYLLQTEQGLHDHKIAFPADSSNVTV